MINTKYRTQIISEIEGRKGNMKEKRFIGTATEVVMFYSLS